MGCVFQRFRGCFACREMADGAAALTKPDVAATIEANAGGPYGSAALRGVREASDKVWQR